MEHAIKKLTQSRVEVLVTLGKEDLQKYINQTEKKLAQEINLEGFRPGKAPQELIRKKIGEEKIKQEAMELAIQSSFNEIVAREELEILKQEEIKIKENTPAKLVYQITVSAVPHIEVTGYTGLNIKKNSISVSQKEIDDTLENIRQSRKTGQPVDRPADKGDKVEVDFTIKLGDKVIDGGISQNHPLVIGENNFIPGFEDAIIGMKTGENKVFNVSFPADYYQKEIAGQTVAVELKLNKIEALTVPELNDIFVKSLGKFNTLTELTENIRAGLTAEKQEKEKQRLRLAILGEITSKNNPESPSEMVEQRLDSMLADFDNELHQKGMELGLYLAHIKKTQDGLKNDWREKAKEQVRMGLVARAIARQEKLNASDEEVNQEFLALADHYVKQGMAEQLKNMESQAIKARIADVIVNEKVFDFLEKNN